MIPLWLKVAFTIWIAVWAPAYAHYWGPQSFLWFCDIGNIMIAVALWRESRFIFSWQAVSVLLVQVVWCIDLASGLAFGVFPTHGAEYMVDPKIPLYMRLLSLFHVVCPILLVWALRRFGYDRRAWLAQSLTALVILPIGWTFGAYWNLNWTWSPFGRTQDLMPPWAYLLVCMAGYPVLLYGVSHLALRWIAATLKWGEAPVRTPA